MRYLLLIVIITLITIFSCKKEASKYNISGKVVNKQLQNNLSGVKVYLDTKKVENGVYNSNFVNIATTSTASDGSFHIEITEEQVSEYQFRVKETGYFDIEELVSVDKVHNDDGYTKNFELIQQSFIELNVKNTMPQGVDDKITYRYTNVDVNGKGCCNNSPIVGNGYDYVAHHSCSVSSHKWIYLAWTISKGSTQVTKNDSIWTGDGSTVIYNINY